MSKEGGRGYTVDDYYAEAKRLRVGPKTAARLLEKTVLAMAPMGRRGNPPGVARSHLLQAAVELKKRREAKA